MNIYKIYTLHKSHETIIVILIDSVRVPKQGKSINISEEIRRFNVKYLPNQQQANYKLDLPRLYEPTKQSTWLQAATDQLFQNLEMICPGDAPHNH